MIRFARSLAGHDKGKVYFVKEIKDGYYFLVDGTIRKWDDPKKKNERHVQIIKNIPIEISSIINEDAIKDIDIVKSLKEYRKKSK